MESQPLRPRLRTPPRLLQPRQPPRRRIRIRSASSFPRPRPLRRHPQTNQATCLGSASVPSPTRLASSLAKWRIRHPRAGARRRSTSWGSRRDRAARPSPSKLTRLARILGRLRRRAADLAGYAVGPGKFALGERLAAKLGGGLAARVAGSAAENAGASVAGTTGHGDFNVGDNLRAAVIGGTVGAATGALPGAKGDLAPSATNSPTAGLQTATKQAFTPLESVKIDPGHIGPAFDSVTANLSSGMKTDMGDALTSATRKISQEMADKFRSGDDITADDIAKFQKTLGRAGNAPGAGPTDSVVAQQYSDALSKAVSAAKPSDWGSMTPGTDLAGAIDAANKVGNQAKTSGEIDNWIKLAGSKPNAVPDTVGKALADNPQFYQTHPDLLPMLQDVANSKPGLASKLTGKVGTMLGEAAINAAGEYLGGQNPLVGGITGAASGLLMGHSSGALRSSALATKLAQIRHLNATGQKLPTSSFAPSVPVLGPLGAYGRQAAPGIGASGAFAQPQTSGSP